MTKTSRLPELYYFCDESSQTSDVWMAVGGLAVMKSAIPNIVAELDRMKCEVGKSGEVKWENAKSFGGRAHRAYVDFLFDLIAERRAQLHIRFSRMDEYDHKLSGNRRRVDTVSKSFYNLMLHRAVRYYRGKAAVFVYPDDGECTSKLPTLVNALCHDGWKRWGDDARECVQRIEPRSSAREPLLQLLDVTLGALAAYRNERHLNPKISDVKRELAAYTFSKTGWKTVEGSTHIESKGCNRWTVKPSLKRGRQH